MIEPLGKRVVDNPLGCDNERREMVGLIDAIAPHRIHKKSPHE
jgi:hypothetical protein